jgi:hypothetical protein
MSSAVSIQNSRRRDFQIKIFMIVVVVFFAGIFYFLNGAIEIELDWSFCAC